MSYSEAVEWMRRAPDSAVTEFIEAHADESHSDFFVDDERDDLATDADGDWDPEEVALRFWEGYSHGELIDSAAYVEAMRRWRSHRPEDDTKE